MNKMIFEIKSRFEQALEVKTGWGKNEVKTLLDQIIIQVLTEHIDKK
jgi:hypothetical protein